MEWSESYGCMIVSGWSVSDMSRAMSSAASAAAAAAAATRSCEASHLACSRFSRTERPRGNSEMGGGRMSPVRGCFPFIKLASCPLLPPPVHLPVCLPGQGRASPLALLPAYTPHVEHHMMVPLSMRVCPLPTDWDWLAITAALVAHRAAADPVHCCGANTDHEREYLKHTEQDHRSLLCTRQ